MKRDKIFIAIYILGLSYFMARASADEIDDLLEEDVTIEQIIEDLEETTDEVIREKIGY